MTNDKRDERPDPLEALLGNAAEEAERQRKHAVTLKAIELIYVAHSLPYDGEAIEADVQRVLTASEQPTPADETHGEGGAVPW